MKVFVLKMINQIIYGYREHTPPSVKYSTRNNLVGEITYRIDLLISQLKNK